MNCSEAIKLFESLTKESVIQVSRCGVGIAYQKYLISKLLYEDARYKINNRLGFLFPKNKKNLIFGIMCYHRFNGGIAMKFLIRDRYLDKLKALINTPDIKVITGIRRCGKSVLIEEYAQYLTKTEPDVNIVMINLQELDYEELLDYRKLHTYAVEHCIKGRHNVLIIDEVQLCGSVEKAINML